MKPDRRTNDHEAYTVRNGGRKAEIRDNPDVGCYIVSLFSEVDSRWRIMSTHRREEFTAARATALRWVDGGLEEA